MMNDHAAWDRLSRSAFAADWDPESAIDWDRPITLGGIRDDWITILQYFYEGEWQGLEIIQRLMNRAAHLFRVSEMVTYYSTQCYDESKHLFVFRRYLESVGAPFARRRAFTPLVSLSTRGPWPVERWILATYFTETLAASIFQRALEIAAIDATAKEMIRLMLKDEARHIAGTRIAVQALLDRVGPFRRAVFHVWWTIFLHLAVGEVRRLKPHGDAIGIDSEQVLRHTFSRMASLEGFRRTFLEDTFARSFLPRDASAERGEAAARRA